MDNAQRSDDELIRAGRDEPDAFAVFYRRHASAVFKYLYYRTRSAEQAADLTAEVFAAAYEGSARYRREAAPARAWLFGIANHKLSDSVRRQRLDARARRRLGVVDCQFHDGELERAEELADLERTGQPAEALVEDLPLAEREAVLARVVHEQSYVEMSSRLGISRTSARKRVSRGLARLASRLTEGER